MNRYIKYLMGVICFGIYMFYPLDTTSINYISTLMRLTVVAMVGCFFIISGLMDKHKVVNKHGH
jgi:hypothetical protein